MSNGRALPGWVYLPAAIGLAVVVVPLLGLIPRVQWSTFLTDIADPATTAALLLSARSALIAVVLCVIFGVPMALMISRARPRLAAVLRTVVTLPLVLPPLVGGVALLTIFGRTGLIGAWLESLGISVPFTPAAVVVAQAFVALPFLVITVEGALSSIDPQYEYVAAGLGASRSRTLFRVTLPLILPGLLAGIVLAFARSVGEFGATALLAGNQPGVTQTIPMAIYTAFNGVGTSRQAAMALSVLLIATALAVLLLFPAARGRSSTVVSANASEGALHPADRSPTQPVPMDGVAPAVHRGRELSVACEIERGEFTLRAELEARPGEVIAVVGPNAAGKTTLLHLVAGHLEPTSGSITLGGTQVSRKGRVVAPQNRNIGVLSQAPLLFPHLDAINNVAFGPRAHGASKTAALQRARELLAQVGVHGLERRKPHELSGGQQQRVALARALATDPHLLVLDEPLTAMDVSAAPSIRSLIAREVERSKITTLLVTHDLLDVVHLATRVIVLDGGRKVEDTPVDEFLRRPRSVFGAALTGLNVLPGGPQEQTYLREEDLVLTTRASGTPEEWAGEVTQIEAAGTKARVRVIVADRHVAVSSDYETVKELLPGSTVWLHRRGVPETSYR